MQRAYGPVETSVGVEEVRLPTPAGDDVFGKTILRFVVLSHSMPQPMTTTERLSGKIPTVAEATPSLREARQTFEREYISTVLEEYGWRMTEAARVLGIERANLYRKTRQLGITRLKPSRAS